MERCAGNGINSVFPDLPHGPGGLSVRVTGPCGAEQQAKSTKRKGKRLLYAVLHCCNSSEKFCTR
jgi:hypothetical protein